MNINEHIIREAWNEYGGSEKKKTILLDDGEKYMLKLPDPTRKSGIDISYINNAVSEYLGSKTYQLCGIPAQTTILGSYQTNGKTKIACLCQDFQKKGFRLHEIDKIINSLDLDKAATKEISFQSIDAVIEQLDPTGKIGLSNRYYDMFVVDALIANTDRHNGNWGVLVHEKTGEIKLSPVYDCGSSYSPLLDDKELSLRQNEHLSITSAISDNHKRINYGDFLKNNTNEKVQAALKRVVPNIDLIGIARMIDSTEFISKERKDYSCRFIADRYEKIILPGLQHCFKHDMTARDNNMNYGALYKNVICPLKEYPSFEQVRLPSDISDSLYAMRVSGKDMLLIDKGECVGLLDLRNNRQQIYETTQQLAEQGVNIGIPYERNHVFEQEEGLEYDSGNDRER